MGDRPLTERQAVILDYLRDEIDRRGLPPTIREIGEHFGIRSTKGVEDHLAALERKGVILREKGKSRAIEIADRPDLRAARVVPLIGRIAAGAPLLAVENREGDYVLDEALVGSAQTFLLDVVGESMKDAAILDGDMVVVRVQDTARNGDIVVARLGDEATVKRLSRKGHRVLLVPENEAFSPIRIQPGDDFQILGKVIGVYRKM